MRTLNTADSLPQWITKYNEDVAAHSVVNSFYYDPAQSYTPNILDFYVSGGILRNGSTFVSIAADLVRLNNDAVNFVVLNTTPSSEAIEVYEDGSVPASEIIPLYRVTVDASFTVTEVLDIRTPYVRG